MSYKFTTYKLKNDLSSPTQSESIEEQVSREDCRTLRDAHHSVKLKSRKMWLIATGEGAKAEWLIIKLGQH
ncbi:MAG: hypothetical protein R8M38_01760 [Mariprofundaceae bacterium]